MREADLRQAIATEARTWLGTPYHHQGAVKGAGADCAMLLVEVYHACGLIPRIDPRPYPADWHLHRDAERFLGWVEQYATPVEVPQRGDVALYRFGRCASHGAIVLDWPEVIHASLRDGEVVLADATRNADLAKPGRSAGFFTLFA
ncbi:NlpC/P60 family protein [Cupriavidus malaysiensis]|uniref:Hydrolase n=1 Tax=Cupriavidus malaysiensis TaxID=367825 RepID=A0ABM6F3H2_9BURK|nr:NlpC/P60 family protein [Cupriavidus malaysiensis]AOZ05969.1 hydrolase [Cupriavidus malaysiensis]